MSNVVVSEFVTLDGVMQAPGGAEQEGFAQAGWTVPYQHEEIGKFKYDELFGSDALLLGRITYQGFAAAWPTMPDAGDFGERMNGIPKHVASTTLDKLEWNNSHLIEGDVAEAVAKLKQQPGQNILVYGSSQLIQTLMRNGLVDEYRLLVFPVVLGSGKRLFKEGSDTKLTLVESRTFPTGVTLLRYQPAAAEEGGAQ